MQAFLCDYYGHDFIEEGLQIRKQKWRDAARASLLWFFDNKNGRECLQRHEFWRYSFQYGVSVMGRLVKYVCNFDLDPLLWTDCIMDDLSWAKVSMSIRHDCIQYHADVLETINKSCFLKKAAAWLDHICFSLFIYSKRRERWLYY